MLVSDIHMSSHFYHFSVSGVGIQGVPGGRYKTSGGCSLG